VTSQLTGESTQRMAEGIRLYRTIPGAKLVLSGGVPEGKVRAAAEIMADFARAMGVPDADIVIEGKSATTFENLAEVKKLVGTEPFILVTSSGHLRRATAVARKMGMAPRPAPAAMWAARYYPPGMSWGEWGARILEDLSYPTTARLGYLQMAFHEYLGYFWYWMLGRI
jgi:uncharacterized SAM-binding protein YcdF (DUF218 family)